MNPLILLSTYPQKEMLLSDKDYPTPWLSFPDIWKNKTAWFTWLRGLLRRGWNKSPVKIEFLKENRRKIKNPAKKGKREIWGADCEVCGNTFPMKDIQVDHKIEAGSLRDFEDIEGFVIRLLACEKEDLQLVCKGCHTIITHSQKTGLSFEEAKLDKEVIAKTNQPVKKQKEELLGAGFKEDEISNKDKRRDCYKKLLGDS